MTTITNTLKRLPEHYAKETTSNNYKFLVSFTDVLDGVATDINTLENNLFISTSSGTYLDRKGMLFNIPRDGLSDIDYRNKIIFLNASKIGGGTAEAIKFALINSLGLPESSIMVEDTNISCVFSITITINESTDITIFSNILSIIDNSKAAGTYNRGVSFESEDSVFRVNISTVNGGDVLL